jgi:hypothetical protein
MGERKSFHQNIRSLVKELEARRSFPGGPIFIRLIAREPSDPLCQELTPLFTRCDLPVSTIEADWITDFLGCILWQIRRLVF